MGSGGKDSRRSSRKESSRRQGKRGKKSSSSSSSDDSTMCKVKGIAETFGLLLAFKVLGVVSSLLSAFAAALHVHSQEAEKPQAWCQSWTPGRFGARAFVDMPGSCNAPAYRSRPLFSGR